MKTAVIGEMASAKLRDALTEAGYAVITLPRNPFLPEPVASHPDLSIFFGKDAVYTTADYALIAEKELRAVCRAAERPLQTVRKALGKYYPQDILLDALPIGNLLFCLPRGTAQELTEHPDYRVIPVRQGYAKCAGLAVSKTALASADPSLLNAAEREGLDILRLSPGGIWLEGYDTGFIGGASSFSPYGGKDIWFCGDLRLYPDGAVLTAFISSHGKAVRDLPGIPLCDVGTIFLLEEDQIWNSKKKID